MPAVIFTGRALGALESPKDIPQASLSHSKMFLSPPWDNHVLGKRLSRNTNLFTAVDRVRWARRTWPGTVRIAPGRLESSGNRGTDQLGAGEWEDHTEGPCGGRSTALGQNPVPATACMVPEHST